MKGDSMTPLAFEPVNFFFFSLLFLVFFGYFLSRLGPCRASGELEETPEPLEASEKGTVVEEIQPEPKVEEAPDITPPSKKAIKAPVKRKSAGRPKNVVPTKKAAKKKPRDRR